MIIDLKLDVNPTTGKCTVVKANVETQIKVVETNEPQLTLEASKYILNAAAVELMGVVPNNRLDIKYQLIEGVEYPVIGTDTNFGVEGGNKLSRSNSVSFRGKPNERLSKFGSIFTVSPLKDMTGLYVLIGDKEPAPVPEDIKVIEDMNNHEDITDTDGDVVEFNDNFDIMEDSLEIDEQSLKFE